MPPSSSMQQALTAFYPHQDAKISGAAMVPRSTVALTIDEACLHAEAAVRRLPSGTRFVSSELLGGVRLRGDRRGHGAVVRYLQRRGLVTLAGCTRQGQEGRNNGWAALWEVV